MYQERGNTAEVEQKMQASRAATGLAGNSYGGQLYANQAVTSEDRDVETLGNTVDRLNGLMHAIGDDLVQIHIAMFGPEPIEHANFPEPSMALEGRLGFIVRLAEAITQETAILRRRIG